VATFVFTVADWLLPPFTAIVVALPPLIVKLELVPVVRPVFVASRVYVPAFVALQPAKAATPLDAVTGFVVQENPSLPTAAVIASVTCVALSFATVRPPESCTVTLGCVVHALPAAPPFGCAVNASFAAAPKMSIAAAGLAATVSVVDLTVKPDAAYVPADGFVTPAIVNEPAVLPASAHAPPLSASWTVTVVDTVVAVAEQFTNPEGRVIVGVAGTVNPAGKTTVIASPRSIEPVALVVSPTVQVAVAPADRVEAENETEVGLVAAAIVTADAGLPAAVSVEVLTLKVVLASAPAAGFVSSRSVRVAGVLAASAHDAPESVTVTVCAAALALAVQLTKPPVSATIGVAGTAKLELKATVTVSPASSAPVEVDVTPTVHVPSAPPVCGDPENEIAVGVVAAAITTFETGLAAVVSVDVFAVNVVFVSVPAAGFVIPTTLNVSAARLATVHVPPLSLSVSVTVVLLPAPLAEQFVKPPVNWIVGLAGTVKPALNVAVIVSPVVSAPVPLVVKPTVHVERAPPVCGDPVKLTAAGEVAAAITTGAAGLAALVSVPVLTLQLAAAIAPAAGFVGNAIFNAPDAEFASAHAPPLFASVIVTVVPEPEPVAEQFV
jgi:hypothetical protein